MARNLLFPVLNMPLKRQRSDGSPHPQWKVQVSLLGASDINDELDADVGAAEEVIGMVLV